MDKSHSVTPYTTNGGYSRPAPRTPTTVVATALCKKYRRLRQQSRSPLSATARRLLFRKLTVPDAAPIEEDAVLRELQLFGDLVRKQYPALKLEELTEERPFTVTPEVGPLANPRLCIFAKEGSLYYKWQVLFSTVTSSEYSLESVQPYLDQLEPRSGYVVCPGLSEYPDEIRFKTKNLREWGLPFNRIDSRGCLLWHTPNNFCHPNGDPLRDVCTACRLLARDINQLLQRSLNLTEAQKLSRKSVSSNYPLTYLSPKSRMDRIKSVTKERKNLNSRLSALAPFNLEVDFAQHSELLQIVRCMQKKDSRAIEELCARGDQVLGQENNLLREAWKQDVIERHDFEKDQSKSVTSHKGNRWNAITVRMALAIFTRSPAAYDALKSFKLLQLPSVRTLKYYIDANLEEGGDCLKRLEEERRHYVLMKEQKKQELADGSKQRENVDESIEVLPAGDGVMIIDEVKVGMRLLWSSRSQEFIGHSMTHEELTTLCDVYKTLDPEFRQKQTSYVLQTLWRDLTSQVDIVGPHYTSHGPMDHKFLLPTLMDAIFKFHVCGFETCGVVCDGAAPNLTMLKELTGAERKAYGFHDTTDDGSDKFAVKTWFLNPYTDRKVHFVICPSHQLKNMVSALFQSRPRSNGGTREFINDGTSLGWKSLQDLHKRELERMHAGHTTRVPKLKESHIIRDSWTRLNVLPSKVMQQEEVLSELREYAATDIPSEERAEVLATVEYLTALNTIFELTLLGNKTRIFKPDGFAIQRLDKGFAYFKKWADGLLTKGEFSSGVDSPHFIAWQTWDLLRVMVYGFKGLVADFLSTHPGHHVNPKRVNGSGVETLFGQLKHTTSGNLTGRTYETAKATLLTKRQIQNGKSKDDYRDTPLNMRQQKLLRKH